MCIIFNNYLIKKEKQRYRILQMCIFIYDIVGEMFKLLSLSCETVTYSSNHMQWCYFCRALCFIKSLQIASESLKWPFTDATSDLAYNIWPIFIVHTTHCDQINHWIINTFCSNDQNKVFHHCLCFIML